MVQLLMASPKDREPKVTKDFLELCENKKEQNSKFSTYTDAIESLNTPKLKSNKKNQILAYSYTT